MPAKLANNRRRRTKEGEEPKGFESLVRQLVAHAKHVPSAPSRPVCTDSEREEASAEVLFSCEVDGVRCVLARSHEATVDALSLSPREQEIARMIAKGHPNKIIASVLDISVWTVSTHLRRIFAKLGVTSRAAMVTVLFKRGLL
jgi:two-component system nitrate/nitrite response regulator NarL